MALAAVNSAEVAQAVLGGAADIGFVEGPVVPAGLHAEPVGRDTLALVVAPAHRGRGAAAACPPASWPGRALISREAGSGTRASSRRHCAAGRAGRAPPAGRAVLHNRDQGRGRGRGRPAVLSSLAVAAELSAGTLRAVTVTGLDLNRTLLAVWRRAARLTGPARDLYAIASRDVRRSRLPAAADYHRPSREPRVRAAGPPSSSAMCSAAGHIEVTGERGPDGSRRRVPASGDAAAGPARSRGEALQSCRGRLQPGVVVIPVLRPSPVQDQQPDDPGRILGEQLADQHQVARGLGHLRPGHVDDAGVQLGPGERRYSGERLGHGRLVGVVRKPQVTAAGLDVDRRAERV